MPSAATAACTSRANSFSASSMLRTCSLVSFRIRGSQYSHSCAFLPTPVLFTGLTRSSPELSPSIGFWPEGCSRSQKFGLVRRCRLASHSASRLPRPRRLTASTSARMACAMRERHSLASPSMGGRPAGGSSSSSSPGAPPSSPRSLHIDAANSSGSASRLFTSQTNWSCSCTFPTRTLIRISWRSSLSSTIPATPIACRCLRKSRTWIRMAVRMWPSMNCGIPRSRTSSLANLAILLSGSEEFQRNLSLSLTLLTSRSSVIGTRGPSIRSSGV
mmetsp:Transcript_36571/g.115310  ORF Transcript_36571/g.115310 Transcript_36571/m.115310 type:complete len:274 (-) Transcript_36571:563-1384(-)